MLYVWYIYLHDWVIFRVNVGTYSSTMEHMGMGEYVVSIGFIYGLVIMFNHETYFGLEPSKEDHREVSRPSFHHHKYGDISKPIKCQHVGGHLQKLFCVFKYLKYLKYLK